MADGNDMKAVIDTVQRLHETMILRVANDPEDPKVDLLAVPAGVQMLSVKKFLDEYLPAPERKKGTATLTSIASFIAHVNRHKDESSVVFAQTSGQPKLTAIYDYHEVAGDEYVAGEGARWCDHQAVYAFPISTEWRAWQAVNDKQLEQSAFAALLEDRIADVADPSLANEAVNDLLAKIECDLASPARLMELSRGLSVHVESRVTQAVRTSSGETQMTFLQEHKDESGKPLRVPGAFLLTIPLFQGGPLYRVPVRLRYRVLQQKVVWCISLYRTQEVLDHAVQEALAQVAKETALPVFEGSLEL